MWLLVKTFLLLAPSLALAIELALVRWCVRPRRQVFEFVCLIGLISAGKFAGFLFLGGNEFNPELPFWIIVVWGWLESVIWVALPIGLASALFAWLVRPFRPLAFWTTIVLALALAAYGMWEGVRVPSVVEREVVVEGLPAEFDGYRLAHLTDLHCSSAARRGKIAAIVERTNSAKPDLIAITGDFVDGLPSERLADLEPLRELRAPDGVVASVGNHERYFVFPDWEPYYRQWGIRFLRNSWMEIVRGDAVLSVGGVDDRVYGDLAPRQLAASAPRRGCRVLLSHRPSGCGYNAAVLDVRLQLSGHTHGGVMPIISRFVALGNQGHVCGFYREGRLTLYVSPGTGQWAGFPLRFLNPPEITLLILRGGESRNDARDF